MPRQLKKLILVLLIIIGIGAMIIIATKIIKVQDIILKKIYSQKYSEYVYKYSNENNIDPLFIFAVIKAESNFNADATSISNAKGLMQLMDSTAEEVSIKMNEEYYQENLLNPEVNIKIGTKYFSNLLEKYNDNYYLAIIAYNAGIGKVDKWISDGVIKQDGSDIENIPYKETKSYVRKIIKNYEIYKKLY